MRSCGAGLKKGRVCSFVEEAGFESALRHTSSFDGPPARTTTSAISSSALCLSRRKITNFWLSGVPVEGGSANHYDYANQDPINVFDLDGLKPDNKEKKRLRKGIRSLRDRIREHEDKIAQEKSKPNPDLGLIGKWEREIDAFENGIARRERRLRSIAIAAGLATAGTIIWWAGKALSPLCGPVAPVCAVVL